MILVRIAIELAGCKLQLTDQSNVVRRLVVLQIPTNRTKSNRSVLVTCRSNRATIDRPARTAVALTS